MKDVLAEICAKKRAHVARAKAALSEAALLAGLAEAPPLRPFAAALERHLAEGRYGLIAEIKKASPSAGLIRSDFDPPKLARAYEEGGASCLSVLTDTPYFQGSDDDLTEQEQADDHQAQAPTDRRTGPARAADEVQHAVDHHGQNRDLHEIPRAERFVQLRQSMDQETIPRNEWREKTKQLVISRHSPLATHHCYPRVRGGPRARSPRSEMARG